MKYLLIILTAFSAQNLSALTAAEVLQTYAKTAHRQYTGALQSAQAMQVKIEAFLAEPSEANLAAAKETWLVARTAYTPTEVYRFFSSPIDDENNREGRINGWPLDEAYIDYVVGDLGAGFLQKPELYPVINAQILRDLNEKDGEKNLSTGYHAIEFMLWGQDLSDTGPGARPASDFGSAPFADRRAVYLSTITEILIEDLEAVASEWDLGNPNSYGSRFTASENETASLTGAFTALIELSGSELSHERMFTALENMDQEEEHSCFSDNTHNDIIDDFIGIKTVLNEGLIELIRARDASVADELVESLALTESAIYSIPAPFDQAIIAAGSRTKVLNGVESLEMLAESIRQGATVLGLRLAN